MCWFFSKPHPDIQQKSAPLRVSVYGGTVRDIVRASCPGLALSYRLAAVVLEAAESAQSGGRRSRTRRSRNNHVRAICPLMPLVPASHFKHHIPAVRTVATGQGVRLCTSVAGNIPAPLDISFQQMATLVSRRGERPRDSWNSRPSSSALGSSNRSFPASAGSDRGDRASLRLPEHVCRVKIEEKIRQAHSAARMASLLKRTHNNWSCFSLRAFSLAYLTTAYRGAQSRRICVSERTYPSSYGIACVPGDSGVHGIDIADVSCRRERGPCSVRWTSDQLSGIVRHGISRILETQIETDAF